MSNGILDSIEFSQFETNRSLLAERLQELLAEDFKDSTDDLGQPQDPWLPEMVSDRTHFDWLPLEITITFTHGG